jgi:hypothetical protein
MTGVVKIRLSLVIRFALTKPPVLPVVLTQQQKNPARGLKRFICAISSCKLLLDLLHKYHWLKFSADKKYVSIAHKSEHCKDYEVYHCTLEY